MEKRRNCSLGAISPLFHNILLSVVRLGTGFSVPDKRLFEISEVEITRVDCIWIFPFAGTIVTCLKEAPTGKPKFGCLRRMLAYKVNFCLFILLMDQKNWPFFRVIA